MPSTRSLPPPPPPPGDDWRALAEEAYTEGHLCRHDWLVASQGESRASKKDVRSVPYIKDAIDVSCTTNEGRNGREKREGGMKERNVSIYRSMMSGLLLTALN